MKSFSGLSRREAALALLAASLPLRAAQGNDYPNRPIKLIVPVPPGSGVDAVSRSVGAADVGAWASPIVNGLSAGRERRRRHARRSRSRRRTATRS